MVLLMRQKPVFGLLTSSDPPQTPGSKGFFCDHFVDEDRASWIHPALGAS